MQPVMRNLTMTNAILTMKKSANQKDCVRAWSGLKKSKGMVMGQSLEKWPGDGILSGNYIGIGVYKEFRWWGGGRE